MSLFGCDDKWRMRHAWKLNLTKTCHVTSLFAVVLIAETLDHYATTFVSRNRCWKLCKRSRPDDIQYVGGCEKSRRNTWKIDWKINNFPVHSMPSPFSRHLFLDYIFVLLREKERRHISPEHSPSRQNDETFMCLCKRGWMWFFDLKPTKTRHGPDAIHNDDVWYPRECQTIIMMMCT